jgi:hypothetical protein
VLDKFDDALAKLRAPNESVNEKLARMAAEERDILAGFKQQLDDAQVEAEKKEEIQRVLKAVMNSISTGSTAGEGKAGAGEESEIRDLENKRFYIERMTSNMRKGNEVLKNLVRN